MGSRLMGGPRESREWRREAEEEQTGEWRWEETLEVKVTEVSRKGSGWEGLNGGLGGALAGCWAETDGNSEALWVILCGTVGGDLKGSVWQSERLPVTF